MKIYIWWFFQNLSKKIRVSLISVKNKGYFIWRPIYIFYHTSLISSYNDKCFRQKWQRNPNTHILCLKTFSENRAVWENVEKYCRGAGHRWQYGGCAMHAGYLRLQIHTLTLCNTQCFSTTMVARTRLNVTLYVHSLSCVFSFWYSYTQRQCAKLSFTTLT